MTEEAFRTALAAREAGDAACRPIGRHSSCTGARSTTCPRRCPTRSGSGSSCSTPMPPGTSIATALAADFAIRAREHRAPHRRSTSARSRRSVNLSGHGSTRRASSLTGRRDPARRCLNEIEAAPPGPARDPFRILGLSVLAHGRVRTPAASRKRERCICEARELAVGLRRRRRGGSTNSLAQLDVDRWPRRRGPRHHPRRSAKRSGAEGQEDTRVSCHRDVALFAIRAMDFREASVAIARRAPLRGVRRADGLRPHPRSRPTPSSPGRTAAGMTLIDRAARRSATQARAASTNDRPLGARVRRGRARPTPRGRGAPPARARPSAAARSGSTCCCRPLWGLAEAALHAGDPDGAAARCDEALRLARGAR